MDIFCCQEKFLYTFDFLKYTTKTKVLLTKTKADVIIIVIVISISINCGLFEV